MTVKSRLSPNQIFYISFAFIAFVLLVIAHFFDGTGGGGDSVHHYQYARYAWENPENFISHWGKPIYTILAFPFAQMGFIGVKVFNILMSLIACYYTFKTLQQLEIENSHWIALLLFSITLYVTVTLSGLTEPLSAAMLMLSIYYVLSNKTAVGISIISFLPFVRSEGLIILGVFFIYLVVSKKYKTIPLLAVGHLVMSLVGSVFYHDLLWVFNKIPYAKLSSGYGSGTWFHFVEQLFYQVGLPMYVLLIIGSVSMLLSLLSNRSVFFQAKLWLVYGCFFAFFVAHTSFWALGIFNSMGLSRVFVSVMPLLAIIALDGINFIVSTISKINNQVAIAVKFAILIAILVFPFLKNPASYKLPGDFELDDAQLLVKQNIVPYINKYKPNKRIIISDICVPYFLDLNPFDKSKVNIFFDVNDYSKIEQNQIIIWDSWFAPMEFSVTKDDLINIPALQMDTAFSVTSKEGRYTEYAIFSRR